MRFASLLFVLICSFSYLVGCSSGPDYGPTVDEFNGQLTHKGEPVSFGADDKVILQLVFAEKGERFGIPIQPDGSFKIGWMPIGKYTAILERTKAAGGKKKGPSTTQERYQVPDGLTISEGQTKYTIELGEGWKP
jgi:hypothetical protein